MKFPLHTLKTVSTVMGGLVLVACGGGNATEETSSASMSGTRLLSTVTASPATSGTAITDVRFQNTNATAAQKNVPVTFGQVFAAGHLKAGAALAGRLDNGTVLPLQVDAKAHHPDGSVRHAVISAVLPSLGAGEVRSMTLTTAGASAASGAVSANTLLANGFSASVHATIGGVRYSAFADDLIKMGKVDTWLAGPTVGEWQVSVPLTTNSGVQHPHLSARIAVRWYEASKKARVDVTIENAWAYEPNPQNFTYDAQVLVGGRPVYTKAALTHLHHARWRKVFWWGGAAPEVNVKHNTGYLIATRAVPNYDQALSIPETTLAALASKWTGPATEPMGVGLAVKGMPTTGGRDDIGLLPSWAAIHLLSMDDRARMVTQGTADQAGSWSMHYRDKNTNRPVSLIDYPYMTIYGRSTDTKNRATGQYEAFPLCPKTLCATPYTHDSAHQPSLAYLPYLTTGDHYYLEELQFWAMWNVFSSNPGYRSNIKGLLHSGQVRAQAWSLRTLAQAAWITPDKDRLKGHFEQILSHNLDWYNEKYTNNAAANKLGILDHGSYAVVYKSKTAVAPWQDDFFTSAVGYTADLGYTKALPLLKWKAKFPVSRMTTTTGACWIDASIYSLVVRKDATSPLFTTYAEAYKASHTPEFNALKCASTEMAAALKLKVGEMTGYSSATTGFPSNMQPALAYGASVSGTTGQKAWQVFMGRSVKPNYGKAPQFAIVPR